MATSPRASRSVGAAAVAAALYLFAADPARGGEAKPDEPRPLKLSGYVFGDYYWFVQDHAPEFDGQNGFWVRRGYLTADRDLGSAWSARFRLEVNHASLQDNADRLRPFVKDLYLRYTSGRHSLIFGLSPPPTWGSNIEEFWGFRHVEKTPLDLYRWADSRDLGLAARGSFDAGKKLGYHAMVGAGTGTRNEVDKDKRLYLALFARPRPAWLFEVYADFENRPDRRDVHTWQAFLGYSGARAKLGLQYARQTRQRGDEDGELTLDLVSAFASGKLGPKAAWLVRVDRSLDPYPGGASNAYLPFEPRAGFTFFLAAIEFLPVPSVHLTPNLELVRYDEVLGGDRPETDVVARLTLYWTF